MSNPLFFINKDQTVSPVFAPHLSWGLSNRNLLVLVQNSDTKRKLIFKELKPTTINNIVK